MFTIKEEEKKRKEKKLKKKKSCSDTHVLRTIVPISTEDNTGEEFE